MGVPDIRSFLRSHDLARKDTINSLKGQRLLWDLSAIWFRFNFRFPAEAWMEIKSLEPEGRTAQIVYVANYLKREGLNVVVSSSLRIKLSQNYMCMQPFFSNQIAFSFYFSIGNINQIYCDISMQFNIIIY